MTPSIAATTRITISVTFAPRSRIAPNACIHMCDMTNSHAQYYSSLRAFLLIHTHLTLRSRIATNTTYVHLRDMTYSYVWHNSFMSTI